MILRNLLSSMGCLLALVCLLSSSAKAADQIFDNKILHETHIVMDPDDWQALRDNFRTNQYYAANVAIDGEVIEQVGVRSRGKGSRDPVKPGLRLDFNRYGRTRDFHGMKSLVLDNEVQDASMLREALAYQVFDAMKMPTPALSFTRVTINDEYWGVYALTEDVRRSFLLARFGDADGNLFQYEWGGAWDFSWRGEDPQQYVPEPFEPQTNEDDLDPSDLVAFIRSINEAQDATFVQEISEFLDSEGFITYVAVENALAESDGMLGDQGMNNFYLYQFVRSRQFIFIPWDKDTSFQHTSWPLLRGAEGNLLVRRLLQDPRHQEVYVASVARAVNEFVNGRWLLPRLEAAYELIRNAVLADDKKPQTNDEFEHSVDGLRSIIDNREDDVMSQLRRVALPAARRPAPAASRPKSQKVK